MSGKCNGVLTKVGGFEFDNMQNFILLNLSWTTDTICHIGFFYHNFNVRD